jgi:hypothetical protein
MREEYLTIAEVAGRIYHALENGGSKTAEELQNEIGVNDLQIFNQALGWLAREDKLWFTKVELIKISLSPEFAKVNS